MSNTERTQQVLFTYLSVCIHGGYDNNKETINLKENRVGEHWKGRRKKEERK